MLLERRKYQVWTFLINLCICENWSKLLQISPRCINLDHGGCVFPATPPLMADSFHIFHRYFAAHLFQLAVELNNSQLKVEIQVEQYSATACLQSHACMFSCNCMHFQMSLRSHPNESSVIITCMSFVIYLSTHNLTYFFLCDQ